MVINDYAAEEKCEKMAGRSGNGPCALSSKS